MTADRSVLHVVVGHGLPRYFLNAVRSVRAVAPDDPLLVVDNASPSPLLREQLEELGRADPLLTVVLRDENDLEFNGKVGSLYSAYALAFEHATRSGFAFVHILQGDFQMMWWDRELVERSTELFDLHPNCVNIFTQALPRDKLLAEELVPSARGDVLKLARYGITDTGLYHLGRWQARGLEFGAYEREHAERGLAQGLEVLVHPWPTDAPIPWPAVVRQGRQLGHEVRTPMPFLLRPLSPTDIAHVKDSRRAVWLEDIAIPWGWVCITPLWTTGVDSIDYWVLRYRDARHNGVLRALPRLEIRGVAGRGWHDVLRHLEVRPPLGQLVLGAPAKEITRRVRSRIRRTVSASRAARSPLVRVPLPSSDDKTPDAFFGPDRDTSAPAQGTSL